MGKSRKTMGISRDSFHKRRKTGGKLTPWRKKRKFELGRPPSMTKIGGTRIHTVRVRGGSMKYRALRLDSGNFAWPDLSKLRHQPTEPVNHLKHRATSHVKCQLAVDSSIGMRTLGGCCNKYLYSSLLHLSSLSLTAPHALLCPFITHCFRIIPC